MGYTIKQAAEKAGLTVYALRYYDTEGLLPFIERDPAGNRYFSDNDIDWVALIRCLKKTGMPIKQIKRFIELCLEGDGTLDTRRQMLFEHRQEAVNQIREWSRNLETIDYKIEHLDTIGKIPCRNEPILNTAQ